MLFVTDSFIYGILAKPEHLDINGLKALLKEDKEPEEAELVEKKFILKKGLQVVKGKEKINKPEGAQLNYVGKVKDKKVMDFLKENKFEILK